ncbi:hypothetical protein MASR1M45_08570 [Candidatus Kapaibacterium sp.]
MSTEFTPLGIAFMILAWSCVIGLSIFSVGKVLRKNELESDDE